MFTRSAIAMAAAGVVLVGPGCTSWKGLTTSDMALPKAVTETPGIRTTAELPASESAALALRMAEGCEASGKDAEAAAYYEKARTADPSVGDRASRRLAVLYDKLDQQPKALAEFQLLLKKHPKDSALLSDVGYSYYNRGQWVESEQYLRKAIAADAANKKAWVNLGLALAQQGRYPESLEAFAKGATQAEAYQNLAFVLTAQKKFDEAKGAYRKALELEPGLRVSQAALAKLEGRDTQPAAGSVTPVQGVSP